MAGLQRSVETFRRSGSSGLVWEERFTSELAQGKKSEEGGEPELGGAKGTMRRSVSNGVGRGSTTAYRTGRVSPSMDPPSPKIPACGFCSFFGKQQQVNKKHKGRASVR